MKKRILCIVLSLLAVSVSLLFVLNGCSPHECLHVGSEWIVDVEPTCVAKGSRHQTCGLCGVILITEEIEMTGHDFSLTVTKPTCIAVGTTQSVCVHCGTVEKTEEYSPTVGHSLDETGICTACGTYFISTAEQMFAFAKAVNEGNSYAGKTVALTTNIDVGTGEWTPIGTPSAPFAGIFAGNGHMISGYKINPNADMLYRGLFGYNTGRIENVIVSRTGWWLSSTDVLTEDLYVGGVVAYNEGGTVSGCQFLNTLQVSTKSDTGHVDVYVGGVVGYNNQGIVETSSAIGTVTAKVTAPTRATGRVGGLLGYSNEGSVSRCYAEVSASATVTCTDADSHVGGLIGYLNKTQVSDCYATGQASSDATLSTDTVSGYNTAHAGGLVAYIYKSQIKNCYATGNTYSDASNVDNAVYVYAGAFAGGIDAESTIANCFATGNADAMKTTAGNYFAGGFIAYNVSMNYTCYQFSEQTLLGHQTPQTAVLTNISYTKEATFYEAEFYENGTPKQFKLGWSTDIWDIKDGSLPTLK
ncbi:MAG: hypothetical protein IJW44_02110 [Clostridia bacterium]|nr:hypothetical protein [Clostridia bacterium]